MISFPKELYEPLWEELFARSDGHGLRIYSIWVADKSDHGASGILNEHTQGDDPSASDLARDLLHMTNVFREEMRLPLVGFGHSLGGTALLELSNMHPRLFASLILIDPVIGPSIKHAGTILLNSSVRRPDLWPSHKAAEEAFEATKAFQSWDPRVKALWLKHGLRATPTFLHPPPGMVTLRTPKSIEAWNYCRPWFDSLPSRGGQHTTRSRVKYPDADSNIFDTHPFYRPEAALVWNCLPNIRPGVLYIFPASGPMSSPESIAEKVARTGKGVGGSGGQKMGRVDKVIFQNAGHLVPFEKPVECADSVHTWLALDLETWYSHRQIEKQNGDDKSENWIMLSKEYVQRALDWSTGNSSKTKPRL